MEVESPENASKEATAQAQEEGIQTGVDFNYDRSTSRLTYRDPDNNEITINGADIIGAFAKPHKRPGHDIVYAVDVNQPGEPAKPPKICSVHASELPADFLNDYGVNHNEEPAQFPSGQPPNTHVIISTHSGTHLAAAFYAQAVQPVLSHLGLREHEDYSLHHTTSATTITDLTTHTLLPRANAGIQQHLILLAGDGGTIDALNALLSAPLSPAYAAPSLTLLPLGTGNALFHST
ncbi:hypothetical protein AOQ84DRAFT_126991, partial [Glonium stellatum]